jgi:conjugative transfer signal peptidase TraF
MKLLKPGRFDWLRASLAALVITGAAFGLGMWGGVRINLTGSLPIGLYLISNAADARLVEFCPPAPISRLCVLRQYRYPGNCPDGDNPLMKPVVAAAGDIVVFSNAGLQVNGVLLKNTAPRPVDSKSRPLPAFPFGVYRVAPGTLWVASTYHPLSFDSRYFGPISASLVRHRLKPFFTL